MFSLRTLPYSDKDFGDFLSPEAFSYHYGKHHQTYVDNLNKLVQGTDFEKMPLEEIIKKTIGKPEFAGIFNNAAQAWNHTFFWKSMSAQGSHEPQGELKEKIIKKFGSYEKFKEEFKTAATTQFGSGWAWLVEDEKGELQVIKTSNADTPIAHNLKPIITCDVWEHAYYLDYQNRRADFVSAFLEHLVKY